MRLQVGVVGAAEAGPELRATASEAGRLIAQRGWILICGGLGGVMEAACEGVREGGGFAVGLLPGSSASEGNRHLDLALPTGMGQGRNYLIAMASDALIAVGGGFGTLSEIALARKMGKQVVSLHSWVPDSSVVSAESPAQAVELVAAAAQSG